MPAAREASSPTCEEISASLISLVMSLDICCSLGQFKDFQEQNRLSADESSQLIDILSASIDLASTVSFGFLTMTSQTYRLCHHASNLFLYIV